MELDKKLMAFEREILALKTAQLAPAYLSMFTGEIDFPTQYYQGNYYWTIYYKNVGDTNPPLTVTTATAASYSLLPYNSATNSQRFEYHSVGETIYIATTFRITSSRPIDRIVRNF